MRNKGKIIVALAVAYAVISVALVFLHYSSHSPLRGQVGESGLQGGFVNELSEFTATPVQALAEDAAEDGGPFRLLPLDGERLQDRFALPALERMDREERSSMVESSQAIRRIVRLGVDIEQFQTPEQAYKRVCQAVLAATEQDGGEPLSFAGDSVSELNDFIAAQGGKAVRIAVQSEALALDASLSVPGGVYLEGRQTRLTACDKRVEKAIAIEGAAGCGVSGFIVEGGCDYGVWIDGGEAIALTGNRFSGAARWGVAAGGGCRLLRIADNEISGNGGGLLLNGAVSLCLVQCNAIAGNLGKGDMEAGVALCGAGLMNDGLDGMAKDAPGITAVEGAPCGIALVDNRVEDNAGAGAISSAGYLNYFVGNAFAGNAGEGLRLDWGSFGCYVSGNTVTRNGGKTRPGVLLDNAVYNTLYGNVILENYGSGIECESTVHRTLLLCNTIADNHRGGAGRGFGIAFGATLDSSTRGKKYDRMACCENIVARNMITGEHNSAVYLGVDSAANDFFDNAFMGCTDWSLENHSGKDNASVNNLSYVDSLNIELSGQITVNVVNVADRVD